MTLTRELRTSVAFILAIAFALTAFVWGNQRLVHAQAAPLSMAEQINCFIEQGAPGSFNPATDYCQGTPPGQSPDPSLAEQLICYVDWLLEQTDPNLPFDPQLDYCDMPEPPAPQCQDGIDNDGDGLVDYPADPGCTDADDDTEAPNPTDSGPACSDGADNDQDGLIDMADPGCSSPADDDETDGGGGGSPACSDGADNDGDGLIDYPADPGCTDANDTDETDGQGGGGGSPQCSDGIDNDGDGEIDYPADDDCESASDDKEEQDSRNSSGGGSRRSSGGSSNNGGGEVLGAQAECPMYLTGYIRQGAQNDLAEVTKLQVFLNDFEAHTLAITGIYDQATVAAVNAFQNKYAADILTPWGARGATGYVYYTTQKQINTIYCKFQKDFPLSVSQIEEIAHVREIQPTLRAQGVSSTGTGAAQAGAQTAPAVGSVVLPAPVIDENVVSTSGDEQTAAGANASSTKGWFTNFVNWLFGR